VRCSASLHRVPRAGQLLQAKHVQGTLPGETAFAARLQQALPKVQLLHVSQVVTSHGPGRVGIEPLNLHLMLRLSLPRGLMRVAAHHPGCGVHPRCIAGFPPPLPTPPRKCDADATQSTAGRQAPPPRESLRVLHQCSNYLVIDKQYDHRIYGNFADTVEKLLAERHQLPAARPCHRLDYATSGCMLWALNRKAAGRAGQCWGQRKVKKLYLALVEGHVAGECVLTNTDPRFPEALSSPLTSLDWPVTEDLTDGFKMRVGRNPEEGRPAHTDVRLLARGAYRGRKASKVLLEPASGRRHQLRVHMLAWGHPIIGDATYTSDYSSPRMMLHAWSLKFYETGSPNSNASPTGGAGIPFSHSSRSSLLGFPGDIAFVAPDPLSPVFEEE
jgi:23S rRNA-/tRNA-specific pseudouridylate synthase